jgi:polyhydroxybutyrate depolymerase
MPADADVSIARWSLAARTLLWWLVAALGQSATASEIVKLTHQGVERTAVLHRQAPASAGARPLVVMLHGQGGTGADLRRWAGFDALADRERFVAVYPDAIDGRWSYGRPIILPMPSLNGETVDDVGFLRGLIAHLVECNIADPARVYVFGVSRGGLMAFTLACALDDVIAAAAPVLTGMTEHQRDHCKPQRPVPIVVIAGTHDATQWYDGWIYRVGRLLSVPESLEFWRARHGCTGQQARLLPHRRADDRTRVALIEWTGCTGAAPLRLYRVQGGGHQLPSRAGRRAPLSDPRLGARNADIETAEEAWAFFKRHAR